MHRHLKPAAQAKKVPPPAIPGDPIPQQQQIPLYRLGGSISSAAGRQLENACVGNSNTITMSSLISSPSLEEGGFNLPRETSVALRIKDEVDYVTAQPTVASSSGVPLAPSAATAAGATSLLAAGSSTKPPPAIMPCPPSVFCATLREPLTHKAAVYYHQQLALQEDQGIDLTQSPGRDSPGSSSGSAGSGSRHSTASLDSGRASSYLTGVSGTSIRGGSTTGSTGCGGGVGSVSGALSSPRCSSVSSCSIGSVDRQRNDELIIDWLMEMKYEEYAQLFIAAGYDLPTIARMTPEDLTAIGIKNPHHRERIKQRIDKLQVLDNLPHFVPGSIEEWLQLLRLEEYIQPLLDQNYKTVRDVTQVTWEDLEDIGIVKLGHQKKILLAIKRVKDIISGKWNPGGANAYQQQIYAKPWVQQLQQIPVPLPTTPNYVPQTPTYLPTIPTMRVSSWDDSKIYDTTSNADAYYCTGSNHECCSGNDVVLIKVRQPRGKSLESLEDIHDNSTRSHLTFSHYTTTDYGHFTHPAQLQQHQQQQQLLQQQHLQHQQQAAMMAGNRLLNNPAAAMAWRRSYDDGDITPTNDATRELMYEEGGGTLPRQQRGILQRAVLNTMPPLEHHHYMNAAAAAEYVAHANASASGGVLVGGAGQMLVDNVSLTTQPYLTGSPMSSKKIAPEPPRRHCSMRSTRTLSSDGVQLQQHHQQQQQPTQQQPALAQNLYYGGSATSAAALSMHHHLPAGSTAAYLQQQQQQQQPIYANYATIQQTTAEIHTEKYHHDNKSNSSIDSIDTIPFANENTGTIKQRLLNRQDPLLGIGSGLAGLSLTQQQQQQQQQQQHSTTPHQLHSSSSSSSSSSTNTIANITHSFHSLKSSTSLHDAHAALMRSDSLGSTTSGGSVGMVHLRSPTLQYAPTLSATNKQTANDSSAITTTTTVELHTPNVAGAEGAAASDLNVSGGASAASTSSSSGVTPKVSVNVLNDIGNMLANLTDELDAMLEEEKRAGLNIDSE